MKKPQLSFLSFNDCSGKVRWLLEELGVAYDDVQLSWKSGDLRTAAYLAKQPMGQVPVFEDGDVCLYESHAIVAYLADKHAEQKLAPDPKNLAERAAYYQWLFFTTNTAEDFFDRYFSLKQRTDDYKQQWETYIKDKVQMILGAIEKQLDGRDYILGAFSAVDPCMGNALDMVSEEPFLSDYPRTLAYYRRLAARPACKSSRIFERRT